MTNPVNDYYCQLRPTPTGGPPRSIYEIWEVGGAFNDSVTPSTYCPEYRSHMVLKIVSLSKPGGRVFSVGCGNGFVEAGLVTKGLYVQAVDCNTEAVALSSAKGVDAFAADYFSLPSGHFGSFNTIYADGLLGHIYRPERGLDHFFETLLGLNPRPGALLVFSNDAPPSSVQEVAPHGRVVDFWLLSRRFLTETLTRFGFECVESYHFPYLRPLSGLRNRTICIARVPGSDAPTT